MHVSLEDTFYRIFHTNDATGALTDADSTPTAAVFEDGSASAAMGSSVANVTTGEYRCTVVCTAANGYEQGKWYNVVIAATVDGIASKKTVATFQVVATPTTDGLPEVDVTHWNGTAVATPTTAGVPRVDVKAMENSVITSTAIAADAIAASGLAPDAATEIANAVWTSSASPLILFFDTMASTGTVSPVTFKAATAWGADGLYVGSLIVLKDQASPFYEQVRTIVSYTNSTQQVVVDRDFDYGTPNPGSASHYYYVLGIQGDLRTVQGGTAAAGAASTITLSSTASSTDDTYNGMLVRIIAGTGAGQARRARDYDGTTKVLTVLGSWATNPDTTSVYVVTADAGAVEDSGITSNSFAASAITATALATDCITSTKIAANAITSAELDTTAITEIVDGVWGADPSGYTSASQMGFYVLRVLKPMMIRNSTAQAGASSTITLDASASSSDDFYNGALIVIVSSTGAGQFRTITDYVGSTKVATVDRAWSTNPDATSVFVIMPSGAPLATAVRDSILDYAYRSGRTVRGVIRRLGAALEKATGLKGSTVTYFQPDGVTEEFHVTQDVANGTRTNPVVTNSEVP